MCGLVRDTFSDYRIRESFTGKKRKMLILIISASLFASVISSPTQNELQNIMRYLQKSEDFARAKTEIDQKTSDDILKALEIDLKSFIGEGGICSCLKYNCGCCIHLKWDVIKLNDRVCANFSYLPKEYGISVTLTVDGKTIINETVSARNPPALCVDVPYLKKYASLCLKFKDLNISKHSFSGCVDLIARFVGLKVEDIRIGCFKMPPGNN